MFQCLSYLHLFSTQVWEIMSLFCADMSLDVKAKESQELTRPPYDLGPIPSVATFFLLFRVDTTSAILVSRWSYNILSCPCFVWALAFWCPFCMERFWYTHTFYIYMYHTHILHKHIFFINIWVLENGKILRFYFKNIWVKCKPDIKGFFFRYIYLPGQAHCPFFWVFTQIWWPFQEDSPWHPCLE